MKKVIERETILTEEEVRYIARLANLTLTDEEVKKIQKQLSETLKYVEALNELNTDKVEPTSQVTGLMNISREDEIKPSISQKDSLSCAMTKDNGFFKTKSIHEFK